MIERIIFYALLLIAIILTVYLKKLTAVAAMVGGVLTTIIYFGSGYLGVVMLVAFFVLGTLATSWKHSYKQKIGVAEINKGQRTSSQVFANAGLAAILSFLILTFPIYTIFFQVMISACFSSAIADTLSSEMGNVYGNNYYNIITLKKDVRGLDGVISLEGTLFGLAGSITIAAIYYIFIHQWQHSIIIIVAGSIGNLSDSLLGATIERSGVIANNTVNFLNTAIAAGSALWLMSFFK